MTTATTDPRNIPQEEHYAILVGDSVYIPGDRRSQTNPGHGYPAETRTVLTYHAFTSEGDFKAYVLGLERNKVPYFACKVRPLKMIMKMEMDTNG